MRVLKRSEKKKKVNSRVPSVVPGTRENLSKALCLLRIWYPVLFSPVPYEDLGQQEPRSKLV